MATLFTLIILFANSEHTSTQQVRDIQSLEACEAAGRKLEQDVKTRPQYVAWSCVAQGQPVVVPLR